MAKDWYNFDITVETSKEDFLNDIKKANDLINELEQLIRKMRWGLKLCLKDNEPED